MSATLSANITPDDFLNQYTFNQVTNMMMSNNNNQNTNLANSNQYTYHTLQSPQIQSNTAYNNQLISSNTTMNSYMHFGAGNSGGTNQYGSKIIHRNPSYSSAMCASSSTSSSPSSLLSSSTSSLNMNQSSNQNVVTSSSNDSFDYDNASSTGTQAAGATNDPAELARQKQIRGIPLTPEEHQLLAKDRQRKDNHNMSMLKFF